MGREILKIEYDKIARADFDAELLLLEKKALEVAQAAYAKYSRFYVGATLLLDNGEVITGSNQENAAYPSGICAERTAIYYAGAQYPNVGIKKMVLVALSDGKRVEQISPCGACRQVIMESVVRYHSYPIYMVGDAHAIVLSDARYLLPFGFDGSDLPEEK